MSDAEQHDAAERPAADAPAAPAPALEATPADEHAAVPEPAQEQPHGDEAVDEATAAAADADEADAPAAVAETLAEGAEDEASPAPAAAPQSNGEATPKEEQHVTVPDISISRPSTSIARDEDGAQAAASSDALEHQPQPGAAANGAEPVAGEGQDLPPLPSKQDAAVPAYQPSASNGADSAPPPSESVAPASRRSSVASTASTVHSRSSLSSLNKGSAVFVITALETISASKEAKGSKPAPKALREAAQAALEMVRAASSAPSPGAPGAELDPRVVFEPLRLACGTRSTTLLITSLDCLAKLVSYSFFAEDAPGGEGVEALADVVTSTVCDTFHDALDERAQLQIVKALLSIVLSTSVHVHQSSLLKAVRTTYNIFLLSKSAPTQAVAQGALTQMVHHVFGRVPRAPAHPSQSARDSEGLLGPPKSRRPKAPLSGPGEEAAAGPSTSNGEGSSAAAAATEEADEEVNLNEPVEAAEQPAEERVTL
jgi:brefeldin A-inhibited guanine nucleotide-exchange protein